MSAKKVVVRVTIMGEEYSIRSDASPEHTRRVADYVDRAIREVQNSGPLVESHKAAILAALQITDELFRERESGEELAGGIRDLSAEVKRWLPLEKREVGS